KSYTTMGHKVNEGMDGIREALAMGLPAAEAAFARALLAETSQEAVDELKKALEADKNHHPSRTLLGMLLLMLGRREEAREHAKSSLTLYPDDPNFRLLMALVLASEKKRKEAERMAASVRSQVSERQFKVIQMCIEMLDLAQGLD